MSKTTPVLLNRDGKKYRLLNITYEDDNSIYFSFPQKGGNYIYQYNIKEFGPNEKKYIRKHGVWTLKMPTTVFNYPKISFHPRDMIAHIIDKDRKKLYGNIKLLSMYKNVIILPFMQVLIPNDLTSLEEYNKKKYDTLLEINDDLRNNNTISLEIYINENDIQIDTKELFPAKRKLIGTYYYDSGYKYTCTIFLSTIDSKNENVLVTLNGVNAIIMCTFSKNKGVDLNE